MSSSRSKTFVQENRCFWLYSIFMHGRSCMAIDPRIPTMSGRSMSGFHRPGRHCLHQARNAAVRCSVSRMKGELHSYQEPLVRRTCIWMTAATSECHFWHGRFQRQQWEYYVAALWPGWGGGHSSWNQSLAHLKHRKGLRDGVGKELR